MLKDLRFSRTSAIICGLIFGEPLRWALGRALDAAFEVWGSSFLKSALEWITVIQPYWIAALLSAAAIMLVLSYQRITVSMKFGGFSIFGKDRTVAGIKLNGVPAEIEDVEFEGLSTAVDLNNAANSVLTSVVAKDNKIGYSIKNSASVKMDGARSIDNDVGFDLDNSPNTDLSNTVAEQRGEARKYYSVKLPDEMKRR